MFTAIFSTLVASISDIFWKKSLGFGVPGKVHDLLTYPVGITLVFVLLYLGLEIHNIDIFVIFCVLLLVVVDIGKMNLAQGIYREEKYSLIAPYTNLNKIFIIIGSFFLFSDVSITALLITLFAVGIIITFSIDFKTLKLPRNIKKIVFNELLRGGGGLLTGWLIINYSEKIVFLLYACIGVLCMSSLVLYLGQFKELKGLPKEFWLYRYIGGLGWISWFLSMLLISNLGLSVSVLLSFLGIGAALFFSYIFMRDVPAKKDIILTVIVTALVGLGFYFK